MPNESKHHPWALLIAGPDVTMRMRVRMLDSLFQQWNVSILGAFVAILIGGVLWHDLHWNWLVGWVVCAMGVGASRHVIGHRYFRRADDRHLLWWAFGFAVTVWGIGLLWGALGFITFSYSLHENDKVYVVLAGAGVMATGATRNHGSPAATLGHLLLISVPIAVAILVVPANAHFHLTAVLIVINIFATASTAAHLRKQTCNTLIAETRNIELMAELNDANASLLASNAALETTSVTDELTGVMNRRGLTAALDRIWRHGARMTTPVGVIMIDIDHFKRFNDHHGHLEGDHCLRVVAATLAATLSRPDDLCARYGGEEFVVMLPGTDQEGCIHMAEALRAAVEARRIAHQAADLGRVSISLGIATMIPRLDLRPLDLLATADQALYRAKTLGRDRWEFGDNAERAVSVE